MRGNGPDSDCDEALRPWAGSNSRVSCDIAISRGITSMCPIAESGHIYKTSVMSTGSVKIESNGTEASKLVVDDLILLTFVELAAHSFTVCNLAL